MDEEGEVKKNGIKDEHSDGEIVPESLFEDGEMENNHVDGIFSKKEKEVSEDPFNLYSLLKRQNKLDDKDTNSEDSLKHPPGFTPLTHNCENDTSEKKVDQNDEFSEAGDVDKLKGSANGSISAGHFKVSEIPRTGGSMVGLLEDVIKVGQVMGFKMEGVIANLEELIGTQGGKEDFHGKVIIWRAGGFNDEIKKSVGMLGTDKAPGPDGFTFGFFRHFWHLVDRDVCEAGRVVDAGMFLGTMCGLVNLSHNDSKRDDAVFIGVNSNYESLRSKFFNGHGVRVTKVRGSMRECSCPKDNGGLGYTRSQWRNLGMALSTLFWDDVWCDGASLRIDSLESMLSKTAQTTLVGQKTCASYLLFMVLDIELNSGGLTVLPSRKHDRFGLLSKVILKNLGWDSQEVPNISEHLRWKVIDESFTY
ncbi:hypothetical protein Tco_0889591 [Tanacetum coccineum]